MLSLDMMRNAPHCLSVVKSYMPSDSRCNVTDKNHHGSFPYQFLSRQAAEPNQEEARMVDIGDPSLP